MYEFMENKERKGVKVASVKDVKGVFKKMLDDKVCVRSYIQKNGTLNGFKDDSIIFVKPL